MDDETAFMELVLANRHGELNWIEEARHAAQAIDKGKWGKSLKAYCEQTGKNRLTISDKVLALNVIEESLGCDKVDEYSSTFLDKSTSLKIIHSADVVHWSLLVKLLMEKDWTNKQIELAVKIIKSSDIPEVFHQWLAPEKRKKDG